MNGQMPGRPLPVRFTTCVEQGEFDRLAELYTGDAVLDAHVPDWRFQVQGPTAITRQLERWFPPPGRFHDVQIQQVMPHDLLVRFEWREREGSTDAIVSREMQLWRLAGDRIAEQVVFCAGRWDAALVAEMAEHAPLVRPRTAEPYDDATHQATGEAIARFDAAFARHDVDAVMAAMTDDCVFEDTTPPDGVRHEGQVRVRRRWEEFFAGSPDAVFETEDQVVTGDRAFVQWRYSWAQGGGGHVRGVDVFRVADGKVAEKQSYVKG